MKYLSLTFLLFLSVNTSQAKDNWAVELELRENRTCPDPMIEVKKSFNTELGGIDQIVDMLKDLDKNNDQRVCKDEIPHSRKDLLVTLGNMDTNQDLCINAKETKTHLENRIYEAFKIQFHHMDGNQDGKVEEYELINRFSNKKQNGMTGTEILIEYDLNLNGVITREEYINHSITLLKQSRKK